jgi:excisionase family DNA binding protein
MDVKAVAERWCISPWTVRSYVKEGKLVPVRIGRRVLFDEAELARFIAVCKGQKVPRG